MPRRETDREWVDMLNAVTKQYQPHLVEAGVTVCLLQAHARVNERTGIPKGPALKLHGYPCMATIKINSENARIEGAADCTLVIDGDRFFDLEEAEQIATFDHELEHLIVAKDKYGQVKLDNCNRPKLKMKPHDIVIGGFNSIVDRHGINALESQQYRDIHQLMTQKTFPWG